MKRLWIMPAVVLTFGFTVLGWVGSRIYQDVPAASSADRSPSKHPC